MKKRERTMAMSNGEERKREGYIVMYKRVKERKRKENNKYKMREKD